MKQNHFLPSGIGGAVFQLQFECQLPTSDLEITHIHLPDTVQMKPSTPLIAHVTIAVKHLFGCWVCAIVVAQASVVNTAIRIIFILPMTEPAWLWAERVSTY